tara:strand:- start:138 stop:293 length:156 start_codon:yes stop_codon:yes gene_type:complete
MVVVKVVMVLEYQLFLELLANHLVVFNILLVGVVVEFTHQIHLQIQVDQVV